MKTVNSVLVKCWGMLFLFTVYALNTSQAQSILKPEKVEISDPLLADIVNDFIQDATENRAFYEDKGIIRVTSCPIDSATKTKYYLEVMIDNRYEDMPIIKYAHFRNYVVLFDSCENTVQITNKEDYFKELNTEIGDRVYQRPTKKGRWVTYRTKEGKIESGMKETRHLSGGGGAGNGTVYVVDKAKNYKKFKSV